MIRIFFSLFFVLLLFFRLPAQDIDYARKVIGTIASDDYYGRGYVNKGVNKAAKYIEAQFAAFGLKSFGKSYAQPFSFPVNTIIQTKTLNIDGKNYRPGTDYLISGFSKSFKGTYNLVCLPDSIMNDKKAKMDFYTGDYKKSFVVIPKSNPLLRQENELSAAGVIMLTDKLTWSIHLGKKAKNYVVIDMLRDSFPKNAKNITIAFKSKFYEKYKTQNTIGYITGSEYPDSFIVIGAHYDHLGMMGDDACFCGANDNASGTAMMLNLAKYYSQPGNKPKYSIVFISFSGEEMGLLGSVYYVQHPLFSLERIKFMVNIDMVGSGSKGITVVNGSKFEKEFARMQKDNDEHKYIKRVKIRGEACNSDHCPFYMAGVPSFFIYTMGDEYTEYHNVYDRPEKLPLTAYEGVFKLMRDFINGF